MMAVSSQIVLMNTFFLFGVLSLLPQFYFPHFTHSSEIRDSSSHSVVANTILRLSKGFSYIFTNLISIKGKAVEELSDEKLYEVARRLTNQADIRKLGLKLGVPNHRIDAIFYTKRNDDITEAAHEMLNEWRKDQPDAARAWITLRDALKDVNLAQVSSFLLKGESSRTGKVVQWYDDISCRCNIIFVPIGT